VNERAANKKTAVLSHISEGALLEGTGIAGVPALRTHMRAARRSVHTAPTQ